MLIRTQVLISFLMKVMKYKVETCVCLSISSASIEYHFEEFV